MKRGYDNMEFSEKFIERNIAELCKEYDMVCGANKNLARVVPTYVDSLILTWRWVKIICLQVKLS
jgi:hypothetical protein